MNDSYKNPGALSLSTAALQLLEESGEVDSILLLHDSPQLLGSHVKCDLRMEEESISAQHARFTLDEHGDWWVEDLGSTNGTWVGGESLSTPFRLEAGQEFELGVVKVRFQLRSEDSGKRPETPVVEPTLIELPEAIRTMDWDDPE